MAGIVAVSQIQFDNGNGTVTLAAPLSNANYTFTLPAANTGAILLANNAVGLTAGSAGAPSVTANTDTASGLFFPAASTVGFSTASTERMRIDASGNIFANSATLYAPTHASTANIDFNVGASLNTSFRIESTGQLYNSVESTVGTDYRSTLYPGTLCRAWVNFNGTATSPITPGAAFNVTNVTKNATGNCTVNFATAMPDTSYSVVKSWGSSTLTYAYEGCTAYQTTTSITLLTCGSSGTAVDRPTVCVSIFR